MCKYIYSLHRIGINNVPPFFFFFSPHIPFRPQTKGHVILCPHAIRRETTDPIGAIADVVQMGCRYAGPATMHAARIASTVCMILEARRRRKVEIVIRPRFPQRVCTRHSRELVEWRHKRCMHSSRRAVWPQSARWRIRTPFTTILDIPPRRKVNRSHKEIILQHVRSR